MDNTVLFVTAFKDLNRETWNGFERSVTNYVDWFKHLSMIPIRLICFCEKDVEEILHTKFNFYNTYPYEQENTFFIHLEREKQVMETESFKDLVRHRHDPETNKPGYNLVQHNKFWFVNRAKKMFPHYSHYSWIDFGCIRGAEHIPAQFNFESLGNRIVYSTLHHLDPCTILSPVDACKNFNNPSLDGSQFFCPSELVEWFYNEYYNMVMWYYDNTLVDDDQEIVKQVVKAHPDRFELIPTGGSFRLLNRYSVPLHIDVVIPTCLKDLNTLYTTLNGVRKNIANLRNIYVVCNPIFKDHIKDVIFIDETIFPFSMKDIAEIIFGDREYPGNQGRSTGWWYQQLLKLYASQVIKGISSNVLVVDSETIFYNTYIPIKNHIAFYAVSNEINQDYRKHMQLLIPDIKIRSDELSGICHQMLFQKHVLQNLFDRSTANDMPFWKKMLCLSREHNRLSYSEYDMYFNFAMTFHKNTVRITNIIRWNNSGSIPDISDYTYLTAHSHLRGSHDILPDENFVDVSRIVLK